MELIVAIGIFIRVVCRAKLIMLLQQRPKLLSSEVPNGLGIVFGLAQLVLYATFYRSTKKQALERQVKWEMGLAATTISGLNSTKTSRVAQKGHAPYVNGT
ncbi:hypothetical protein RHGRI_019900 [Rhododendron griersonianum]|uniref:Uncharacterized protein n=1 Tax=Rhododendron griersonianum TaxID=479676 RepID=A0AAV6JJP6_9ERIC|nr:hypothetical protein RHGRI_019900 [Rhododendron griersonianum]